MTGEAALERLLSAIGGDVGRLTPLLERFEHNASAACEELVQACRSGDNAVVARVSHRLKGSAPLYGASELAAAAEVLEHRASAADEVEIRAVEAGFAAAQQRFATFLADHRE